MKNVFAAPVSGRGRLGRAVTVATFACAVASAACLQIATGTDAGTTSGATGAGATGTTTSGAAASVSGTGCATDPQTQITLCQSVDVCPGITVDESVFVGCGFRLHGDATLDLECLCDGTLLCPIGVPDTCAQASQILASQSALAICGNAGQGSCVDFGAPDAGTAATTGTTSPASSCDKACEATCAGEPDCLQLCGC